jgi:spore maturation protein CgeB
VRRAGCREVTYLPFAYEPSLHFPEAPATAEEAEHFRSDVVFVGGADRDRVPYFEALLDDVPGLCLHLYGGYWDRYPRLRHCYRGVALGRDYRLALACTKVALCLVRRSNRDGHVMRTFELPACRTFMLAERTEEHLDLFEDGKEAGYFGTPEELVEKTRSYLSDDAERTRIAEAAFRKVRGGKHTYQDRLSSMLAIASRLHS